MPPPLRLPSRPLRQNLHHSQSHARTVHPPRPSQCRRQHTSSHPTDEIARFSWLPRVLRRSTWQMVIPSFLRNPSRSRQPSSSSAPARKRNPATYFIWIYLLIGSQAIRIIGVQSEFTAFTRRAELRLQKLREVLRALQAGEDVDVEKELGTGVESEEKEWEEAMREIEEEEDRWVAARRRLKEKEEAELARRTEVEDRKREEEEQRLDASPIARQERSRIVSAVGFY